MQGPDFKVGKTDIIDAKGTRVVTETSMELTSDGKSIFSVKTEKDFNNDDVMDEVTFERYVYDDKNRLIERSEEFDEDNDGQIDSGSLQKTKYDERDNIVENEFSSNGSYPMTTKDKYLYETGTDRLVKSISTTERDYDVPPRQRQEVTSYEYDDEGRLVREETELDRNIDKTVDARKVHTIEYDQDGNKVDRYAFDYDNNGIFEKVTIIDDNYNSTDVYYDNNDGSFLREKKEEAE